MTVAVFITVVTLGYALACWAFPFRACLVCGGDGRRRSKNRRTWRHCRWCRGTGERLRIGRRVWNAMHRNRR